AVCTLARGRRFPSLVSYVAAVPQDQWAGISCLAFCVGACLLLGLVGLQLALGGVTEHAESTIFSLGWLIVPAGGLVAAMVIHGLARRWLPTARDPVGWLALINSAVLLVGVYLLRTRSISSPESGATTLLAVLVAGGALTLVAV